MHVLADMPVSGRGVCVCVRSCMYVYIYIYMCKLVQAKDTVSKE